MKPNTLCGILFCLIVGPLVSCNKQSILDQTPPDSYSDASMWTDINLADRYLLDNYNTSLVGPFGGYLTYASLTDESHDTHNFGTANWLQGNITPANTRPFGIGSFNYTGWNQMHASIQRINGFLDKADQIPDAYLETQQEEIRARVEVMKGEALFLRAFCYNQLVRSYGGMLLFTQPFKVGDDYLASKRASFKESVDFIVSDCDAAAALLPNEGGIEMGRATKGAALALKSRILLFAASDLAADGTATNEYVGYQGADRTALWTAAKQAAKAVMDLGIYSLEDFGAPDEVAQNFFNFFKAKDLSSPEVIWGKMYLKDAGSQNRMNLFNGSNGFVMYGCNGPTANLVDAFQMEDGSDFFDHYYVDGDNFYRNNSPKYHSENMYYNREPRFYATILYDSAVWQKRFADLAPRDPLGIYDRRTRITISGGQEISKLPGIDTRQGPVDPDDGTYTGYTFKKYQDENVYGTETNFNDNIWIEFRYAEILLNYAEACLGLGETGEATDYINMVRNRAGLPDFVGDPTEALRHERQVEFVHEDLRWYDIRRWKALPETIRDAKGVDIVETNNLDNGTVTTTWRQIHVQNRGPVQNKMYWLPIPVAEINRAPQLEQNPGYN